MRFHCKFKLSVRLIILVILEKKKSEKCVFKMLKIIALFPNSTHEIVQTFSLPDGLYACETRSHNHIHVLFAIYLLPFCLIYLWRE